MNITTFITRADLLNKTELEKARLLAYYHFRVDGMREFTVSDVIDWFQGINLAKPNGTRLKQNIIKSALFVKGRATNTHKLSAKEIVKLDTEFPELIVDEEVVSLDTVLPASLYQVNRGYIEAIRKQINACYENSIYDGCAILMRRLLEILLVHVYEHKGIQSRIQDADGNFVVLERIVDDAKTSIDIGLSRNTKPLLDKFRTLGNFSAHKIYYICKRQYIDEVIQEYRATVEELEYKSGLKK